jgi:hypothetical protein
MDRAFSQVNDAFESLRVRFQGGEISRQAFIDEMKKLRIRDGEGRFWMIGAQTGKWYYFDGKDWVQSEPPTQKDHAAVCVFCGFENDLEANACARCGGTIGEEPVKCPDCGSPLRKPFMTCPKCGMVPGGIKEDAAADTPAEVVRPASPTPGTAAFQTPTSAAPFETAEAPAAPLGASVPAGEMVVRSVDPASLFFFWGAFGLLAGILAGAFVGATGALQSWLGFLPESLVQLQGTLFGALLDALIGAALGLLTFGSIAFVFGFLANLILAVTGGVLIRTGRPEATARKTRKKKPRRAEGLSLTDDGGD